MSTTLLEPSARTRRQSTLARAKETEAVLKHHIERLTSIIDDIECGLSHMARQTQSEEHKLKAYPFIPYRAEAFIELLAKVSNLVPQATDCLTSRRFLDVGAGQGSKVIIARSILGRYWQCEGIEIDKRYVDNRLTDVTLANGLTFNEYHLYDVIYMYCPMCDAKLQCELMGRAIEKAKAGAILVFAGCMPEQGMIKGQLEPIYGLYSHVDMWRKLVTPLSAS